MAAKKKLSITECIVIVELEVGNIGMTVCVSVCVCLSVFFALERQNYQAIFNETFHKLSHIHCFRSLEDIGAPRLTHFKSECPMDQGDMVGLHKR